MLQEPGDAHAIDHGAPERSGLDRLVRRWLPVGAAAGLIAIVALASRTTSSVTSTTNLDGSVVLTAIEVVGYVAAAIGLVVFVPVVIVLRARRRNLRANRLAAWRDDVPWWARIAGFAFALAILAVQIALLSRLAELLGIAGPWSGDSLVDPTSGLDPNGFPRERDTSSLLIALVVVIALAALAAALAIRWRLSDVALPDEADNRRGTSEQAVELGLDVLRREPDPRRAIIAAYAAMEHAMARAGLRRQPWESPLEYLRRMLAAAMADAEDVRTLTRLFEVAKFSQHGIDEAMRSRAISALDRIRTITVERR